MGGRNYALLVLAATLVAGACSEGTNDVATEPQFGPRVGSCNFTTVSTLVKNEFGASSSESGLATDMKNAGAQTTQATSIGYQILKSIGDKYDLSQTSTTNASALTVALLNCMDIGTATVPAATVFDAPLGAHGAYGVKLAGDFGPVTSHDGHWLLEPPGTGNWGTILPTGTNAVLAYGAPVSISGFSQDTSKSNVFDWSTLPTVTFKEPGAVVGECTVESQYLQHNAAGSTAEILGFVTPSCYVPETTTSLLHERAPRTFAERVIRLLSPAPAFASLMTTTGSGGSKRTLSPFQVVKPTFVNLQADFSWKKSGNVVGTPFFPVPQYEIKSQAGTKFLQDYVLIWIEAVGNQGVNVDVCNNWAYTNANGVVTFPAAYANKSGGYTFIAKTFGTSSKPGVTDAELPSVPPGQSLFSPIVNVKNGNPGTCRSYHEGDPLPEVPGPNGFAP
jgi:hypothetical protein